MAPEGGRALALHADLEGQLSMEECQFLLTRSQGRKTIVEIGSYRGKSTVLLALGCADVQGKVTAIDPHMPAPGCSIVFDEEDERVLRETIRKHGVADRVDHWVMTSVEARPKWGETPIDMLWIDGDHSEEGVRTDLEHWAPLVRVGGIVAGHDYTHREGVKRAWDAYVGKDDRWTPSRVVRSIVWNERVK
ncbi:MAG: class I SAM-dependent methyltransferase [Planctomycetota bacterium]|nr:class I SAM-dependent methyltransferase [Planctomycetota bacterium]